MRTAKGINGSDVMISGEEYRILRKIYAKKEVFRSDLKPYEDNIAETLMKKGVLGHKLKDGKLIYYNIQGITDAK